MKRRFFLGLVATLPVAAPAAPMAAVVPHDARRQRHLGKIANFGMAYGSVLFFNVSWVTQPVDPNTRISQRTT